MLLNSANIKTETNCNAESSVFKIEASSVAFDILSSKLYSNPILAIVRELCTNAYDSHKAAGKENVPIKINLPSHLEPNFIIRDYGLGLSKEDIMEMYTTFFSSTKSSNNDFTGCFGLGSKTPFSYTSSFTVNSYWNGIKYFFVATKKDGLPHIYAIREEPTDESNGLEISIPTDKNGGYDSSFTYNMSQYLKYIPEIQIDCSTPITREEPILEKYGVRLYKYEQPYWDRTKLGQCYIKQGQNVYEIDKFIKEAENVDILRHFLNYSHVVIEVPIGTLHITPSRESLSQDEQNSKKVFAYIEEINEKLKRAITDDVDAFNIPNTEFMKMYNEIMTKKYFSEHPLQVKITDSGECKIQHECGIHKVDATSISKNSAISQTKESHFLLVPSNFSGKDINKLKNTINNYEELEDVNIYIAIPHGGFTTSLLQLAKLLKATVGTLNNIPEYSFDIEYQTINQFYKKYTNHKKQRDTSYDPTEKRIRYKYASIVPKGRFDSSGYDTDSIEYIKGRYKEENTIVIFKEAHKTYNCTSEKAGVVHYFLQNIKDKEGNNFVYEYLKELLPNLDNLQMIHFLEISKTAKKYFKEYEITSFDRIFEFIQEADWFIATPVEETLLEFVTEFDDMFKANFKSKAYDFISRTKSYYKLTRLKAIAENNTTVRNTLDGYALNNLQKYLPKMVNKKVYSSFSKNILSDKLRKLFNIFDCSRKRHKSHWSRKRNEWEGGNTHFRLLSKTHRLEVLGLLKGDL